MYVHRSNRMEALVGALASVVSEPQKRDPFAAEVVVVQSQGMERWLSLTLASRLGIWTSSDYPFPRAFVERVLDILAPREPGPEPFRTGALVWSIAALLPLLSERPEFQLVAAYLRGKSAAESNPESELLRRLGLARRVADAFDQYLVFRPDWLLGWESGERPESVVEAWQPILFQELVRRHGREHFAARLARVVSSGKLAGESEALLQLVERLPERIHLFGIASLPPLFVQLFEYLGHHCEVHWYLLTPSPEYLGDEPTRRELARRSGRHAATAQSELASALPLLASLGRTGRELSRVLEETSQYEEIEGSGFVEPEPTSLLRILQGDLCALRRRGPRGSAPAVVLATGDRSLEVHSCHGPRRELEVLRELLLDAFETDPTLVPEDVLVMLRDVEAYSPLVDAVFGATPPGQPRSIPYAIADRTLRAENTLADAVVRLLEGLTGRLSLVGLFELLELEPVQRKMGLEREVVIQLRTRLSELGARWGVDAEDRARLGLPSYEENTLRFGLRRLILGTAMSASGEPYFGVLPDELEGDRAEQAGVLAAFIERLFVWRQRLIGALTLAGWTGCLGELVAELCQLEPDQEWQKPELLKQLQQLVTEAEVGGFDEALSERAFIAQLREHFEGNRSARAFLTGGVTFSAMLPMRSIPFRVIAMVGLDDTAFPRPVRRSSIDGIAAAPRLGDRSSRDEDRHLFLEALLSARERLILTYIGRSPRDDSTRPPSVVLEELLEAVDECAVVEDPVTHECRPARQLIVVQHPLQAFGPRYFDGKSARLTSRDLQAYRAAVALAHGEPSRRAAVPRSPGGARAQLSLASLREFLNSPARYWLRERLRVRPHRLPDKLAERETLTLAGLERWKVSDLLLGSGEREVSMVRARAQGWLPPGKIGEFDYSTAERRVAPLRAQLEELRARGPARTREFELTLDGALLDEAALRLFGESQGYPSTTISGSLELHGTWLLDALPSKLAPGARLSASLCHLLGSASAQLSETHLLRLRDGGLEHLVYPALSPEAARLLLANWVTLAHWAREQPLPYFPELRAELAQMRKRCALTGEVTREQLESCELSSLGAVSSRLQQRWEATRLRQASDHGAPPAEPEVMSLFGDESPFESLWPEAGLYRGLPRWFGLEYELGVASDRLATPAAKPGSAS